MVFSFVAVNTPKIQKTQKPLILQGIFRQQKKRVMGIEPTYPAWKAGVLPLNYTRMINYEIVMPRTGIGPVTRGFSVLCSTN